MASCVGCVAILKPLLLLLEAVVPFLLAVLVFEVRVDCSATKIARAYQRRQSFACSPDNRNMQELFLLE